MKKKYIIAGGVGAIVGIIIISVFFKGNLMKGKYMPITEIPQTAKTIILAGGCFWCVESDLEKVPGVYSVISGYSGGTSESPTYKNYAQGGHIEVIEMTYDPEYISLEGLLEYFVKHIDPTDSEGSFVDRGFQYSPAIYYSDQQEKEIAEKVLQKITELNVFEKPLTIPVLPRQHFWPAEDYHQNYAEKNPIRYKFYRLGSGRDAFIKKHWGDSAKEFPAVISSANKFPSLYKKFASFQKPSEEELKSKLDTIQYRVTQEEGTERSFTNEYDSNKAEGIYVDIVSGEPLFSSTDKYDSKTGWPSFTKPIDPMFITKHKDRKLLITRTEIRSRFADSHIGHVFKDGPKPEGLRYCMNSAALRFIPKNELEAEGLEELLSLFK